MLEARNIFKTYENKPLLKGVTLTVSAGETVCLLGASGSGKSTLLRIIAGLESAEAGKVLWNGAEITNTPAYRRNFGLMFQDYALFPHLSVAENVAFGLHMQKRPADLVRDRVEEVLSLVNLQAFSHRRVTELSGGEQQRVALARALAPDPRLLMFDEPLGALDRALRDQLLQELRVILHRLGVPVIYVTHDQGEAFALADRVALLQHGNVVRQGSPKAVWTTPGSSWVAEFLGLGKILHGVWATDGRVQTELGALSVTDGQRQAAGSPAAVLIRPEKVYPGSGKNHIRAVVSDVLFQQDRYKITLQNGLSLYARQPLQNGVAYDFFMDVECLECLS